MDSVNLICKTENLTLGREKLYARNYIKSLDKDESFALTHAKKTLEII